MSKEETTTETTTEETQTEQDQNATETVSRAEFERVMQELTKHKTKAKALEKEQNDAKTARLKETEQYKELAAQKEQEAQEALSRAERIEQSYISSNKYSALQMECQKLGIRPEAISDLEGLDLSDLQIETTNTGKITVLGASKFAQRLKTQKPHWFQDPKTTKVNTGGGNRIIETDGAEITAAQIYEAEKAARKSGDMTPYYELHKKFQQQRVNSKRH